MNCLYPSGNSNANFPLFCSNDMRACEKKRIRRIPLTSDVVYPLLEQNITWITDLNERKTLSKIIALQSEHMLKHPADYMDRVVRFGKKDCIMEKKTKKKYFSPRTLSLKLMDDGESFRVQVYGEKIDQGADKTVRKSIVLELSLLSEAKRVIGKKERALLRSKKARPFKADKLHSEVDDDPFEGFFRVFRMMKTFFTSVERKELHFGGIPEEISAYKGKRGLRLEWDDDLYSADLNEARNEGKIGIDSSGKFIQFRVRDIFRVIELSLRSLREMHKREIVHCDVTPKNIMLYFDPETNRIEFKIIDFDKASFIGDRWIWPESCEYPFWDRYFQEKGYVLPTTDLFGVTTTLASFVFGFDIVIKLKEPRRIGDYDQIEKLINAWCQKSVQDIIEQFFDRTKGVDEERSLIKTLPERILKIKSETATGKPVRDSDIAKNEIKKIVDVSTDNKIAIRKYLAYCYMYYAVSELLWDVYKEDKKLYDFMTTTPEAKMIIFVLQNTTSSSLKERKETLQKVYDRCPFFVELDERIRNIREGFEALQNGCNLTSRAFYN